MILLFFSSTLLSFLLIFFLGRFIGLTGTCLVLLYNNILLSVISIKLFFDVCLSSSVLVIKMPFLWFSADFLLVEWSFFLDSLSVLMMCVIVLISLFVQVYSVEYLFDDPSLSLFLSYLVLFEFFMLILIGSGNFFVMFFGWEGVGLASFLLINFWYTRNQATKSAIKAMFLNRVGDFGLSFGIFGCFVVFKSVDFLIVFPMVPFFCDVNFYFGGFFFSVMDFLSLFFFIGVMGKSAQFGLHAWLPDAMEGPTPVSALLHAATMVTAGVFLMLRLSYFFEYALNIYAYLIFIGLITALFGAILAGFQYDLKKIIAYSTCSQIGLMIFACTLSLYSVALFHFFTHAFFKALLFLSAGSIIHAVAGEQDIRYMRGLAYVMPFTLFVFYVGALCLATSLFTSGFYSKDWLIHVSAFISCYSTGVDIFLIVWFIVGASGTYITNILFVFFDEEPFFIEQYNKVVVIAFFEGVYILKFSNYLAHIVQKTTNIRESQLVKKFNLVVNNNILLVNASESFLHLIFFSLFTLTFLSLFAGYLFFDFFVGISSDVFLKAFFIQVENYIIFDFEYYTTLLDRFFMLLVISFDSLLVFFILHFIVKRREVLDFVDFFFFFDSLLNYLSVKYMFRYFHNIFYKEVDKGFFDNIGPVGLILFFTQINMKLRVWNNGYIFNFLFLIFFCIVFFVILILNLNVFILFVSVDFIFFCLFCGYVFLLFVPIRGH